MIANRNRNIDRFVKGLYTSSPNSASGYEDPTYLGFRLRFEFNPIERNHSTLLTDDPLFASAGSSIDSAERYLRAINMPNRAAAMSEFRDKMRELVNNYPWYIQSVEGLADLWRIPMGHSEGESFNNYRTAGKKLTFGCLESIDLRITALADLYRKATFDQEYMRDLLPENLKWFTLELDIAEMRHFHEVANNVNLLEPNRATNQYENGHDVVLKDLDNLISVITFRFTKCMFDFNDSFPQQDTMSMTYDPVAASSKFSIIPGSMKEKNQYTLLNYVLTSYEYNTQIGKDSKYEPAAKRSNDLDAAFNARRPQGYTNNTGFFGGALNRINQLGQEAIGQVTDRANEIAGAPANLAARGLNYAGAKVTGGLLGNVYGGGNKSIQELLSPFFNKETGTLVLGKENVYSNDFVQPPRRENLGNDEEPFRPTPPAKNEELGNAITG